MNDEIAPVEFENLRFTFDELFTKSVTDGLVTYFKQVGDIWNQRAIKLTLHQSGNLTWRISTHQKCCKNVCSCERAFAPVESSLVCRK